MTVIDCFMVCYETDVIDIRIVELADVVDAHHAVQGTTTFRGDPLEPQHLSEPVVSRLVEMPEGDRRHAVLYPTEVPPPHRSVGDIRPDHRLP